MGVRIALARYAARRAHVLVVEVPGRWALRVAAERRVTDRGWRVSGTPADADVLLVCGLPAPELAELVDRVWDQLPGPRTRIELEVIADLDEALELAASQLADVDRHRDDALNRRTSPDPTGGHETDEHRAHEGMDHDSPAGTGHAGMDHAGMQHAGMDHSGHEAMGHSEPPPPNHAGHQAMDHSSHEGTDHSGHQAMSHGSDEGMDHTSHGGMDHSGHGGMDHGGHGGMEMAPHGIPLAGGGEDRDGLEMDVLHLSLGPVLRYWPAGLVLTVALQGDLVVDATVELLEQTRGSDEGDRLATRAARLVDQAVDVLALAGWADGASQAMGVRDLLLDGRSEEAELSLRRLHRRVARSWLLRRSLRGAGRLDRQLLDRHDLPAWLEGNAYDRLLAILDGTLLESLQDRDGHGAARPADAAMAMVRALPHLVSGLELAEVRLLVASLALDTTTTAVGARHG